MKEVNFSIPERMILANQLKILEKLYPGEENSLERQRIALEEGFSRIYDEMALPFNDEMSREECDEVFDILDMYSSILHRYNELEENDKENISNNGIKFEGFDGNNETKQLEFTIYLLEDIKENGEEHNRFYIVKKNSMFPDFNSHRPMLAEYREKLKVWNSVSDKFNLKIDDIISIVNIKVYDH